MAGVGLLSLPLTLKMETKPNTRGQSNKRKRGTGIEQILPTRISWYGRNVPYVATNFGKMWDQEQEHELSALIGAMTIYNI